MAIVIRSWSEGLRPSRKPASDAPTAGVKCDVKA